MIKQILLFLLIVSLLFNVFQYINQPEVITKTQIDTLYVQLPPEIIVKDNLVTKYVYVTDSLELIKLNDSLKTLDQFIKDLIDQLNQGKVYTIFDTTKFTSGDSIQTTAMFWPLNLIQYNFFPRADKTIIVTHNNTIIQKWSLIPTFVVSLQTNHNDFNFEYYLFMNMGIGLKHYSNLYQIEYGKSFNSNSSLLGIKYGREFNLNLKKLFIK